MIETSTYNPTMDSSTGHCPRDSNPAGKNTPALEDLEAKIDLLIQRLDRLIEISEQNQTDRYAQEGIGCGIGARLRGGDPG